jgi:hypothetical protein
MHWNVAPIDSALLSLVQLIQPAHSERVYLESRDTMLSEFLDRKELLRSLNRLEKAGFLLRSNDGLFVVAPKSYALVDRSLDRKERDKARLLFLNRKRYEEFGLGA